MPYLLLLFLLLAGCAQQQKRQSWDGIDLGARKPPAAAAPAPAQAQAQDRPAFSASPRRLPASDRPPQPLLYGAPPGGRLLATFDPPGQPGAGPAIELPDGIWLAALPAEARAGAAAGGLSIDGAAEFDVDGDGRAESIVLARPRSLFERKGAHRLALLLVLAKEGGGQRLLASARFLPQRHALPGRPARWCHAEYRIVGSLQRDGRQLPLIWEERGVGCAQLVDGGFDRLLHLASLDGGEGVSLRSFTIGSARLRAAGGVDLYDGIAWAADPDGDGSEELLVRGIRSAARPCGGAAAFWEEELAWRVEDGSGSHALHEGRAVSLEGGALPAALRMRHAASCGAAAAGRAR